jgi:hypothetical protein
MHFPLLDLTGFEFWMVIIGAPLLNSKDRLRDRFRNWLLCDLGCFPKRPLFGHRLNASPYKMHRL